MCLLLRKEIYPYEYVNILERFSGTSSLHKKQFYNSLNMEAITYADQNHAKRVQEKFKIKNLGDYPNLYVQSYTLLPAYVFKSFQNQCIEKFQLNSANLLSAPGLAWQAYFKKTRVELEL